MTNTPLGNLFAGLNKALDSRPARAIGLRKLLVRASYSSAYNGVRLARRVSGIAPSKRKQSREARLEKAPRKDLFDLNYTEEQQMICNAVRDFVDQQVWPNAERCSEEGKVDEEICRNFRELGLAYYAVPEAMGGIQSEQSTVTQMAVAETLAFGDLGVAYALLAPISAINALVRYGSAAQQERYITPFLDEQAATVASIAVDERQPLFDPFNLSAKARATGNGYSISGEKAMVPMAGHAAFFLVAAELEGEGPAVFIVDAAAEGLDIRTDHGMGLRPAETCKLILENAEVEDGAILLSGDSYREFIDLVRLGWCSLAVGTCHAALEYVIRYCNDRVAFGEPITHRQSVAFMIADMKIEVEGMRVLTQRAVSRAEQGLDFSEQAYLAYVQCSRKAMEIGTNSVQLLGGYGYCRDYPAERWYRDLRAVGVSYNGIHL